MGRWDSLDTISDPCRFIILIIILVRVCVRWAADSSVWFSSINSKKERIICSSWSLYQNKHSLQNTDRQHKVLWVLKKHITYRDIFSHARKKIAYTILKELHIFAADKQWTSKCKCARHCCWNVSQNVCLYANDSKKITESIGLEMGIKKGP